MYYKLNESVFDFIKKVNKRKEDELFKEKYFTHFAAYVYSKWFFYDSILKSNYSYNDFLTVSNERINNLSSKNSKDWIKVMDLNEIKFKKLLLEKQANCFSPHFNFVIKNNETYVSIDSYCKNTLKWFVKEFIEDKETFEFFEEKSFEFVFDLKLQYRNCLNQISLSKCIEMNLLNEVDKMIYDQNISKLMTDEENKTRSKYKEGIKRISTNIELMKKLENLIEIDKDKKIKNIKDEPIFLIILKSFENKG